MQPPGNRARRWAGSAVQGQLAQALLTLADQHGLDGPRDAAEGARLALRGAHAGEVDAEGGPEPGLAVDPDAPAALLDDAVDGGEAEPGALAGALRREE